MNTIGLKFILAERFIFDPTSHSLIDEHASGDVLYLGSNESRILKYLVQHPRQIVRRCELHDYVWRKQGVEVDDSSLTQAISTLRKTLNDSIKSPLYIKTVPKQGYRWIANVESTSVYKKTNPNHIKNSELELAAHTPSDLAQESGQAHLTNIKSEPNARSRHDISNRILWLKRSLIAVACAIPLITIFALDVHQTPMESVTHIKGIDLVLPPFHPDISAWVPSIERCITQYSQTHQALSMPSQVIATGGEENRLVLNIIYPEPHIELTTTLVLFANQHDLNTLCQ
jgi:cholera toxin transcriptional activator